MKNLVNVVILKEKYKLVINHELMHMSSTYYRESDGKLFSGFRQAPNIGRGIGVGLNEGYTHFLTKRYFGNDALEVYEFEKAM